MSSSKGFIVWHNPGQVSESLQKDPRIAVAMHMEWQRQQGREILFANPQPDNFNRALLATRPIECKFIADNVFYKELTTNNWWSLYYVPWNDTFDPDVVNKVKEFDTWMNQQDYLLAWRNHRPVAMRPNRELLYVRKGGEMTVNERLWTMGYYTKLHDKYFSDNSKMLESRLGLARAELNDLIDISQQV